MGLLGPYRVRLDSVYGIWSLGRSNAWIAVSNELHAVLSATFIGGSIASVTWAYTAEGIVKFMHQYKLEAVIPLIIIVFVGAAFLHIRSTKCDVKPGV